MCTRKKIIRTALLLAGHLIFFYTSLYAQNLNNPNKVGPLGTQVNTASGNLFIPRNDLYVPARIFDFDISFYYNSYLFREDHGYGKGWTFKYNIKYSHDTTPGARLILWGDGREDKYDSLPGGSYKTPKGFYAKLVQHQPGQYVLTEKDSIRYYFNNPVHRRITRIEEPNGNFLNFIYTDSLLTAMSNPAGQSISFTYNPQGRLATVVDAIAIPSRTFTYSYDGNGNLKEVKDPLNGKYQYSYLVNGPMKSLADRNNNKIDIIYFPDFSLRELVGCNKRMSFSYDTASRTTIVTDHLSTGNQVTKYVYEKKDGLLWLVSKSGNCCGFNMSYQYDEEGNKVKITDANGHIYTYTYDGKGNMLTITDPLNQVRTYTYSSDFNKVTSYKDMKGFVYTIEYDENGNLIKLTTPGNNIYTAIYNGTGDIISSADPKGNIFIYNYDTYGNPTNVTGPNGYNAALSFDARGRLLSYTNARNYNSTVEYDILDRLRRITDPMNNFVQLNYDAEGNMTSYINKNNETSIIDYDASNRIVKVTRPTGNQTSFTYDGMDNLTGIKNALGHETKMSYDKLNRVRSSSDAENNNAVYSYDGNGNVTSIGLANGRMMTLTYDQLNRPVSISDATGTIGTYSYDKNNNLISYTNGTGAITSATYDSLDRIKFITDPLGNSKLYSYDKNSNVISITDREGRTSYFGYDSLDRVKTYTDNNGFVVTVGHDAVGNIVSLKDQNNNITTYTYDSLNRRKTMIYPDGKYIQYEYDKKNNPVSVRRTDATTVTYLYDTLNRMTSRTLPDGEIYSYTYDKLNRVLTASNNNGTVTLTYDALNRITSETFGDRTIRYNYSIAGRTHTIIYPDSTTVIKEFDTRNRLTRILKNNAILVEYAYNNANQLINKNFANGISTTMQYDFANRLSNISTGAFQNSSYTYDKEMNRTAIIRSHDPSLSEQFSYDNGYRLTNYKRGPIGAPLLENSYTYDAVGNRTAANLNGSSTTYSINNLNQLTGVNSTSFIFDDRGNLTFDGTFHKTYDAENRLKKDSASPANVITYEYDALKRRIIKTINGTVLKYTYSGVAQIEERNSNGDLLNQTVFTHFLSPVLNEKDGTNYFYHSNELNSVEAISNSNGRLIETYQYDVYGKPSRYDSLNNLLTHSIAGNRFGFTGQEYDSATNSYRFFYRNYSPETGVFNQRDLIEYRDGMGMYQYTGNNPANGIDVWGLDCRPNSEDFPQEVLDKLDKLLGKDKPKAEEKIGLDRLSEALRDVQEQMREAETNDLNEALREVQQQMRESQSKNNASSGNKKAISGSKNNEDFPQEVLDKLDHLLGKDSPKSSENTGGADGASLAALNFQKQIRELQSQSKPPPVNNNNEDFPQEVLDKLDALLGKDKPKPNDEFPQEVLDRLDEILGKDKRFPSCEPQGGTLKPPVSWWDSFVALIRILIPLDPNEIIGPDGQPNRKWVSINDRMPYTILFENDSTATARTRYIKVTTPIEPKQDPATLELGSFGFNNQSFEIPAGTSSYYQRLDCRDSTGLYVDIVAGLDVVNNQIFWEFQGIDPITLLPPEDPLAGFLFLQDSTQPRYGNGFVNFSIKPLSSSQTLDTIGARAFIVFDSNDTIPTNIHTNTIDAVAPTSSLAEIPALTPDTEVTLTYTGTDDPNGSGVRHYSIYVSDDNGAPELYVSNFTGTDTTFKGLAEHSYKFYVTATDTAGNIEMLKLIDSVRISSGEFVICPDGNVSFDSKLSGTSFQWQVDNGTGYTNISEGGIYSGAIASVLSLTAAPTSMYGYKFRCLVNGVSYSDEFLLKFGMTWEGGTNTSWENVSNWNCHTLPDMNTDVIISGGKANYPQINSNVIIRSLKLNPGATGTVNTGFTLTIVK